MRLEIVELVMSIENEFGIQIDDTDAAGRAVVGVLFDYVAARVRKRGQRLSDEELWPRFCEHVASQLGVRSDLITRTTHLIDDLRID